MTIRYYLCGLLLFLMHCHAYALQLSNVFHQPKLIKANAKVAVHFKLDTSANVELKIYDSKNYLVRNISASKKLTRGEHKLKWDGLDQAGRPVPSEVYYYTLSVNTNGADEVVYDVTDITAENKVVPSHFNWNVEKGLVEYHVNQYVRLNIRAGLNDGPLMNTIVNWAPREPGLHREKWDGKDESGFIDVGSNERLKLEINAFKLSANAIIVQNSNAQRFIQDYLWGKTKRGKPRVVRTTLKPYAEQEIEQLGDFTVKVTILNEMGKTEDGIPIISGTTPIRFSLDEMAENSAIGQRFEPVIYLDGQFSYENEVGVLPFNWRWNTAGINKGLHYISINIRGYEGNFGMGTQKVYVK